MERFRLEEEVAAVVGGTGVLGGASSFVTGTEICVDSGFPATAI